MVIKCKVLAATVLQCVQPTESTFEPNISKRTPTSPVNVNNTVLVADTSQVQSRSDICDGNEPDLSQFAIPAIR